MLLTIFTPTYNREHTIVRVFDSLKKQTIKDFEWLVVDDGSTDNTAGVIDDLRKDANFPINYIKKVNGGKHTAYNIAIGEAKGELFFTVDSDDWLPDNAVELISDSYKELIAEGEANIGGIISLKVYPTGKLIGKNYTGAPRVASFFDLDNLGYAGERTIILKSNVAKQFPFPVLEGERFMGESVVYDRIAQQYKMLVVNQAMTICEYQSDGLTRNIHRIMARNPGGYAVYYSQRADLQPSVKGTISMLLRYNVFRHLFKGKSPLVEYKGKHQTMRRLLMPVGLVLAQYYKRHG